MIGLLFLLVASGHIWAQSVHNVVIPRGQPYQILTPKYPDIMEWNKPTTVEWDLQVEKDSQVKLVCMDIRMVQRSPWGADTSCPEVYLSVEDGHGEKKVCGSIVSDFNHKSDGSKMIVRVVTTDKGSALAKCVAYNTGYPDPEEIVKLEPTGRARQFKVDGTQGNTLPNLDRFWLFESTPGTRISLQCDFFLSNRKPNCGLNVVSFNNGEVNEELCGFTKVTWFSKANKANLRFQLDQNGYGKMNCLVQAVTGPNANEYENVVSDNVDSSEHGVTAGVRNTSCKCGWTNKSGARIINGIETGVNEFPWMVHMYVDHEVRGGKYGVTCGASIITPRHVLTAAHCVVMYNVTAKPENVHLELAKHDSRHATGKEILIGAERIFIKNEFIEKGLDYYDFAVVLTRERINFSNIVGPICIEPKEYQIFNQKVIIMGWGNTGDSPSSEYLRKGKSIVMDRLICGGSLWDVCTTSLPSSFCSGDSGGPLVWLDSDTNRYSQISLVSRGHSCTGQYLKSTLVSYFYDWIQEVIKITDHTVKTCHKV